RTADGSVIVLDAGTGIRVLGDKLVRSPLPDPIHVFITHAHWDHIVGAPFFAPLWRKDAHIVFHSLSERAETSVVRRVLFDGEHFPVRAHELPARIERPPYAGDSLRIGSARVSRIELNHPGGADGFRIDDDDGSSLCYLTDNELSPPSGAASSPRDVGLLIHDAQYLQSDMPQKRGWGHSLVEEVLELGRSAGAREVVLHHHDPARDDRALDRIALMALDWCRDHARAMMPIVAREGLVLDVAH